MAFIGPRKSTGLVGGFRDNWRFKRDIGDRLIVGNGILQRDYGCQWRVVWDIRNVHARMWQAQHQRYSVRQLSKNRCVWLGYVYSTVIELFQCGVWRAARKTLDCKGGSPRRDCANSTSRD